MTSTWASVIALPFARTPLPGALVTQLTSGAETAPGGSRVLTRAMTEVRSSLRTLMISALATGMPSELATVPETTAPTPLMPSEPSPVSGSRST
jgi:hypothetical protein